MRGAGRLHEVSANIGVFKALMQWSVIPASMSTGSPAKETGGLLFRHIFE